MKTVKLILVDRDDLTGLTTWAECSLCGCSEMHAITDSSEAVWDSDPAACSRCGALDFWVVDEGTAHLAHRPDDIDYPVEVLRRVFNDTGRAEWEDRAKGVDAGDIWYVVVDGDAESPLLSGAA